MLKKNNRLKKTKDFENVFKNGFSFYNKLLGLKIANNNSQFNRFGLVVGLKVSKKAVLRNKIKRQLRYAVKKRELDLKKGFDVVVITRPEIINKSYLEIEEALNQAFLRVKLF